MTEPEGSTNPRPPGRIAAIDIARGVALLAMASYHFTWDLEFFGYIPAGTTGVGAWKLYARCIASSFLFLVGVSLFLAHGSGIRWRPMLWRLAMVAGAAAAISAVTYFAVPQGFIFFGILHQIALASVLGLAFLRMPSPVTLAMAALVIAAPHFLRSPIFDHPALWWLGLAPVNPRSNDYVPVFPWFGAVLIGIAVAKAATGWGWLARLARISEGGWGRPLVFLGRHSLAFYLIHQPILIGLVWLATQVVPPPERSPSAGFSEACRVQCEPVRDVDFCARYCGCMLRSIEGEGLLDSLYSGKGGDALQSQLETFAGICSADSEAPLDKGGVQ
jgi:uncharacterized membrane protein